MYQTYCLATTTLLFAVLFLLQAVAGAANLLVNGDFSLGNTGFTSDYIFTSNTVPEGTYCVDTDPQNCHPGAGSYKDHTSGDGLMLNANGSVNPDRIVWQQTVPVAPHMSYTFTGWAASWGDAGGGIDPSPAQLRFFINAVHIGQDLTLAPQNGQWLPFVISWNSASNTSATITIVDVNVEAFGNDFSLDDLSMIATVNDFVTFEPTQSTFTFSPDPTGCPEGFVGIFSFEARLTNTSDHALTDLIVVVTTLTNGNLLQNADSGPGGVGAQLTVPEQDGFTDGVLSPDEFVDVPFIICLTEREPFQFVVDVAGDVE